MATPTDDDADDIRDVRVWFGRLEAKLDVAIAQHGARLDEHGRRIDDHETRIREIDRAYVSRAALVAAITTAAIILGAVLPLIDRLYGGK